MALWHASIDAANKQSGSQCVAAICTLECPMNGVRADVEMARAIVNPELIDFLCHFQLSKVRPFVKFDVVAARSLYLKA